MSDRTEYINGLRAFADWLEANADVPTPFDQRLLLPLSTNPAVEAFAAKHGRDVQVDDEGNNSCTVTFGQIQFHAYGYRDFAAHVAASEERDARCWADKNGLELRAAGEAS